ncbi:MAG: DUF2892 domain-containing protein [Acidobacteria bacterium]|nr:DUF2892 domain-containing protein [Acidobacteriota bacterium]
MEHNVGTADRVIRILMGIILLGLIFVLDSPARWIGLIGIIPLMTALMGWCPLYTLLGVRTCSLERGKG